MSAATKDGGQAFPSPGVGVGISERQQGAYEGMTLRDYFAAHEPIDPNESIGIRLAEMLAGRPLPLPDGDKSACPLAVQTFWAYAEAKYRYLRADAMLKARLA